MPGWLFAKVNKRSLLLGSIRGTRKPDRETIGVAGISEDIGSWRGVLDQPRQEVADVKLEAILYLGHPWTTGVFAGLCAAGKILIRRFQELMESGESFAIETTLSGRGYTRHIANLKRRGYRFDLIFLWLPSEDLAIARVAQRVVLGGHNIPEPVIRRRYKAGLSNFFSLYRPLADSWRFYDCSVPRPRLIA